MLEWMKDKTKMQILMIVTAVIGIINFMWRLDVGVKGILLFYDPIWIIFILEFAVMNLYE